MVIYFVPFVLFLVLASVSRVFHRGQMRLLVFLVVLGCVLLAGLRYETDKDYESYVSLLDLIPPLSDGWDNFADSAQALYLEPTFALFVSALKVVTNNQGVFFVIASTSLLVYYIAFKRVTHYPAVAFLVYFGDAFYLREFTAVRFGLAAAVGFLGMAYLYQGNVWRHRLVTAIACMAHVTGAIFLLCQPWAHFVRTKSRILGTCVPLFALALAGVLDGAVELVAQVFEPARLLYYIDNEQYSGAVATTFLVAQFLVLMAVTISFKEDEPEFFFVSIYALSFALLCVFSGFEVMRRVAFFLTTALYVLASWALFRRRYGLLVLLVAYSGALLFARMAVLEEYQTWL